MATPISYFSVTVADNTKKNGGQGAPETAIWRVPITTLTPANVAATETLTDNLLTAVQAVILGVNQQTRLTYNESNLSSDAAASQLAQREKKWLLRYHDSVNPSLKFTVSIPTSDLTKLPNHQEFLDLTAGVGLALKTAFEAVVVSPDDSANTVVLDSVQYVGRKS